MQVAESSKIFANVHIGKNVTIEDFCLIGVPPKGVKEGELKTVIGDNAVIRSHTVIYAGTEIGNNFQSGNKVNIREHCRVGDDVSIGTLSVIEHRVEIHHAVRIHSQAFVPEYSLLKSHCWIGPNCVLTNAKYPLSDTAKEALRGPTIEEGAILGANTTVLPALIVGKEALLGAGSVVTQNIPAGVVAYGHPAKVVKNRNELPYS